MTRVTGHYRLGLRVSNLDAIGEFYRDVWSMTLVESDSTRRYLRSRGQNHIDLVLQAGDPKGLEHLAFETASEADLVVLLRRVQESGTAIAQQPMKSERPDEVMVASFDDPDGNRIQLVVPKNPSQTAPGKLAIHIGHVVLWSPQIDVQEAFYARLGFQVSDRSHLGMSFLRCNRDHHTVALARGTDGRRGMQHVAFDVGTIDQVMREHGRLKKLGLNCIWGVGRHGPGNNVFSYYRDPDGNVIEYYGDMERVDDTPVVEPKFWGPEHQGDIWGVAGPAPGPFRG